MQVRTVKISDLVGNGLQNPSRHEKVADLKESIAEVGQLEPILLTKNGKGYIINNGHRRINALKQLGKEEVWAVISTSEPRQTFAEIGTTSKPLAGRDQTKLAIEGCQLRGVAAHHWETLRTYFSVKQIAQLFDERPFALSTLCHTASSWCDAPFEQVFRWFILSGTRPQSLHQAMGGAMTPRKFKNAVQSGRRIDITLVAD